LRRNRQKRSKKKTESVPVAAPQLTSTPPPAPAPIAKEAVPANPVTPPPTATEKKSPVKEAASQATLRKSVSLNRIRTTEPQQTVAEEKPLPDLSSPFTQSDLESSWKKFASNLEKQGRITLHTALVKRTPALGDNFSVTFSVDNMTIEKDLNEIKVDLLSFIRADLSNYKISLDVTVSNEADPNAVPYTPSEKFKKLAEKNPLLNELKRRFDLEIEY
jgi:DNA polymerase-3 subunit gamma/tau